MSADTGSAKKTGEECITDLDEYVETLSGTERLAFYATLRFLNKNPTAWDLLKDIASENPSSWPDVLVFLNENTPNAVPAQFPTISGD